VRHLALQRRHHLAALVDPEADELGELLLERHLQVQLTHPLGHLGLDLNDGHETFLLRRDAG
jgi:hypothetical protein